MPYAQIIANGVYCCPPAALGGGVPRGEWQVAVLPAGCLRCPGGGVGGGRNTCLAQAFWKHYSAREQGATPSLPDLPEGGRDYLCLPNYPDFHATCCISYAGSCATPLLL